MSITSLGSLPIASINVGLAMTLPMLLQYQTNLASKLVLLEANITAAGGISLPNVALIMKGATELMKNLENILTQVPTASFSVKASMVAEAAQLTLEIAAIAGTLEMITGALAASVSAHRFDGNLMNLGKEIAPYMPNEEGSALILSTGSRAAFSALSKTIYTGSI